jgi:hypothetical protein
MSIVSVTGVPTFGCKSRLEKSCFLGTTLFLVLTVTWGCGGVTSGKTPQGAIPTGAIGTFGISGTISPSAGGNGATIAVSGVAAASTMAGSSGNYAFTGLANGTYVVAPSRVGYSFAPGTQSVTINGADVTGVNFTASPQAVHLVSLSWTGSPTATVAGYNVYRSTVSGSLFARVNAAPVSGLTYTDSTVQNGVTYYFVATAVDTNGLESVFSNQVSAVIP